MIKRHTVIPHGLDDDFRLPRRVSYQFRTLINLVYVSPVLRYKHQDKVVLATRLLRERSGMDIRLRLVGGGRPEDVALLRQVITEAGASGCVTIVPFVSRRGVLEELKKADVFIFASSCETFGISLLEAMGARLPIACSSRSGLSELLGDAGEYFEPEEEESIAHALEQLLTNEDQRRIFGEAAFLRSLDYTWARCAKQTADFVHGGQR